MINQALVKKLRSDRFWSQEHLAMVSGISLRTIQRIENQGRCSIDSKKALAAAFDLEVKQLLNIDIPIAQQADKEQRETITSWLELVDIGEYSSSWQETSPLFRRRITRSKWVALLNQVRKPLGDVISRQIAKVKKHTSLPSVPDGEYIIVTLETAYTQKRLAIETIVLSKESTKWQVIGYFIK